MWGAVISLATWLLGKLLAPKEPTTADLATKAVAAESQLDQEKAANEALAQSAVARTAADVASVRADPAADHVTSDPAAAVNTGPGAFLR